MNSNSKDVLKYIYAEDLYNFRYELLKLKNLDVLNEFDNNILKIGDNELNDTKRLIYHHQVLSRAENKTELNKKYYELYQKLKTEYYSHGEAIEEFEKII